MMHRAVASLLRRLRGKRATRTNRVKHQEHQVEAPYTVGDGGCGWSYYPPSKVAQPTAFFTHDNGGRPFAVVVTDSLLTVRSLKWTKAMKSMTSDEVAQPKHLGKYYPIVVVPPTRYVKLFVGRDPMCTQYKNKDNFIGNSMLAELPSTGPKRRYVHISGAVVSFYELDDVITGYASPVGRSDVTYEYAVGRKNIYLFTFDTFMPRASLTIKSDDPYSQATGQLADRRYKLTATSRTYAHRFRHD